MHVFAALCLLTNSLIASTHAYVSCDTAHCPLTCFNGGGCCHDQTDASFFCRCDNTDAISGHIGKRCETPFVTCVNNNRCLNDGICRDNGSCECINGFKGKSCETYTGHCDPDSPENFLTEECRPRKTFTGFQVFLIVAATFVGAGSIFFIGGRYYFRRSALEKDSKEWEERKKEGTRPTFPEDDVAAIQP